MTLSEKSFTKSRITSQKIDYSQWYLDVIDQAELSENSVSRGAMVIKPYGYAIWENIQRIFDAKLKSLDVQNAYFPLLIPKSLFTKEAQHIEGFAQESAVVTHHRLRVNQESKDIQVDENSRLAEEYVIRPTSETIIYDTFSKWVESYRDLPLKINQWANVVRWEMRTRPFIRSLEFLWQEGHTVHTSPDEAEAQARLMNSVYTDFLKDFLAIYPISGCKSESEKFAGADKTYTNEIITQDLKAIQATTSHNLGNNFAKAFNIQFTNQAGAREYAWQTSWGLTTRLIGCLIMSHGDDRGLVLPPMVAPYQLVILPIIKTEYEKSSVDTHIQKIKALFEDRFRIKIDSRVNLTIGEKHYYWERRGVPFRIEVGIKEAEEDTIFVKNRIDYDRFAVHLSNSVEHIQALLNKIQAQLLSQSKERLQNNLQIADNHTEFEGCVKKNKFILAYFCDEADVESKIKERYGVTSRCSPFSIEIANLAPIGKCLFTSKENCELFLFAKSY